MEVNKRIKLEATERENCLNNRAKAKKEYGECIGCLDLQEKVIKADEKCAHQELDIGKKDSVIECLGRKVAFVELQKLQLADEAGKLKQRNGVLERIIQDSKEEHEKLMIENKVLDCEKKKAESDLEVWKVKCKELEVQVTELEKSLSIGTAKADIVSGLNVAGTTPTSSSSKRCVDTDGFKGDQTGEIKPTVKKRLDYAMDWRPFQNFFPSTPGCRPPVEPFYLADSDDDLKIVDAPLSDVACKGHKRVLRSSGVALESIPDVVDLTLDDKYEPIAEDQSNEEETSSFTAPRPFKRRKVFNHTVSSESESDDNIPISRLRSMNQLRRSPDTMVMRKSVDGDYSGGNPRKLAPRRRLRRVGDIEHNSVSGKNSLKSCGNQRDLGISEKLNEDEMEGNDSTSEGESLGGFIVDSSDTSDCHSGSNCNDISEHDGSSSGDCLDESERSIGYDKIMSSLRRERKDKLKWDSEQDMLADFGKSTELCMKAVFVLYRQQTSEEKAFKATIHSNGRGFSQCDASRGTALAEFLTDGDPHGDITKTVKELQKFDSEGVEMCHKLAEKYSKQLFAIYKSEEVPFFHP